MPFTFSKLLNHGSQNFVAVRLSLQIMQILDQCDITKELRDDIADFYLSSLLKKLVRCWEIKERFRVGFEAAVASYQPPQDKRLARELPQIDRLDEEVHNFLYEAKNYIRDTLKVFNLLYGTAFSEASEFSRAKKRGTLVSYAGTHFGEGDSKTAFFKRAAPALEEIIDMRNAVEHPGGYSGTLIIRNLAIDDRDGKLVEPFWYRDNNVDHATPKNDRITQVSPIQEDLGVMITNLLHLGEGVVVSWATDHLKMPQWMRIAQIELAPFV